MPKMIMLDIRHSRFENLKVCMVDDLLLVPDIMLQNLPHSIRIQNSRILNNALYLPKPEERRKECGFMRRLTALNSLEFRKREEIARSLVVPK